MERGEKYGMMNFKVNTADIGVSGCTVCDNQAYFLPCTSCEGSCAGDCGNNCTGSCSGSCSGTCSGDCSGTCSQACRNGCEGSCWTVQEGGGACTGNYCTSMCQSTCTGTAQSGCLGVCQSGCGANCTVGCYGACDYGCGGGCASTCSNECGRMCSSGCADSCTTSCSDTCYTQSQYNVGPGCEFCESLCSKACESSCSGGCKGTCTGRCDSTCTATATSACGGACTTSCGTACTRECGNSCLSQCIGTCADDCALRCTHSCTETCSGTCYSEEATGQTVCKSACEGSCKASSLSLSGKVTFIVVGGKLSVDWSMINLYDPATMQPAKFSSDIFESAGITDLQFTRGGVESIGGIVSEIYPTPLSATANGCAGSISYGAVGQQMFYGFVKTKKGYYFPVGAMSAEIKDVNDFAWQYSGLVYDSNTKQYVREEGENKIAGQGILVTASEWNQLAAIIRTVARKMDEKKYSAQIAILGSVNPGVEISREVAQAAVDIVNAKLKMNLTVPTKITAKFFNDLKDAVNNKDF